MHAPRGIAHSYVVRSERAHMLVTLSPSGVEELFVSLAAPVSSAEPPTDAVMPPMEELVSPFAGHRSRSSDPPLSLDDLS